MLGLLKYSCLPCYLWIIQVDIGMFLALYAKVKWIMMFLGTKGCCKKNYTTILQINLDATRGLIFVHCWSQWLTTMFLTFQETIQTIFIGLIDFIAQVHKRNWTILKLTHFRKIIILRGKIGVIHAKIYDTKQLPCLCHWGSKVTYFRSF